MSSRLSVCILISDKDNNNTIQVYSVTVMIYVIALEDGQSSQGTSQPITPELLSPLVSRIIRSQEFGILTFVDFC